MNLHNGFIDYLSKIGNSKFSAYTGESGGYITFENTGKPVKAFTLSLESIFSGLSDIESNLSTFSVHSKYDEKEWRDLGGAYFTDTALKSISTVQTKPLFTTFAKIISWANGNDYVDDNNIDLNQGSIKVAKETLQKLIHEYHPANVEPKKPHCFSNEILRVSSLRDFALQVFNRFYGASWDEVIEQSITSNSLINSIEFISYKFDPFVRLLAGFEEEQSKESLTSGKGKTQRFFDSPVYESQGQYYYFSTQWNGKGAHSLSFDNLKLFFEHNYPKYKLEKEGEEFLLFESNTGPSIRLPKPFILLSGISGTGKTRFVKQQAQKFKADGSNYQLVPVRPDWHEPSDLLGYVSRLGENGAEYIVTDFLVFLVSAWKEMVERVDAGEIIHKANAVPFWLCLDEMNLAPVEQYFADYLSIIESRQWSNGQYQCEPLLNASILTAHAVTLRASLQLEGAEHDALWDYFIGNGISIPPNLIVAGTVNMDETTHGFSRKVIDRAFTLDFGEFFPNDYNSYFTEKTQAKALSYPMLSRVEEADLENYDEQGRNSIAFLKAINGVLKSTPFELAYRALNELLLAVVCFQPKNDNELQAVWDDFLMTKVLPRIEGDAEKLGDDGEDSLLSRLNKVLDQQLADIWDSQRIDLLREGIDGDGVVLKVDCRAKNKIEWMQKRLQNNGFTSFWP